MIYSYWGRLFVCLAFFLSAAVQAGEEPEEKPATFSPAHANWVFSGVVTNETDESYGYFFQIQRDGDQFRSLAALLDAQTKKLIFLDESQVVIHDPEPYNWQVGHAFLRFNPINESWIFGVKTEAKKGFNFKVDTLKQFQSVSTQDLRPGIELSVNQTGHLNGHIQIEDEKKEQFVTAKNAWFRQVWLTAQQDKTHPFTGVLCRFNNGSGFYSVNMTESDALRGAVAGWCDEHGVSSIISQFINVKQDKEGPWHIRISSPNIHLVLSDFITQNSVIAGFVTQGKNPGFCMLSNEMIGGA